MSDARAPSPSRTGSPEDASSSSASKSSKKGKKKQRGGGRDDASEALELASPSGVRSDEVDIDFAAISVMPSPSPATTSATSTSSTSATARRALATSLSPHEHKEGSMQPTALAYTPAPAAHELPAFERNIIWNDAASRQPADTVQTAQFPSNIVRTSKYTVYDFLPRNLFEQLSQPANAYFLFVGVLQAIPAISTTNGIPTHYLPLLFILTVSAIRSAYEDYGRYQADEAEGRKKYLVYDGTSGRFITRSSGEIVVGDIVKMIFGKQIDESGYDPATTYSCSFPADLMMLSSSQQGGHAFVETASLDGETNLKIKNAIPAIQNLLYVEPSPANPSGDQTSNLRQLDLVVDCEAPNARFDSFKGVLTLTTPESQQRHRLALKAENLLLRGTELRNTSFVLGLVVYTGIDTKIRRNVRTSNSITKQSSIMRRVNYLLVYMLLFQAALCLIAALLCLSWTRNNYHAAWYLEFTESPALAAFRSFFTWWIILAQVH